MAGRGRGICTAQGRCLDEFLGGKERAMDSEQTFRRVGVTSADRADSLGHAQSSLHRLGLQ